MSDAPPKPWVTYALIAVNLAAFGYELAHGVNLLQPTEQQLVDVGASAWPLVHDDGEWWRLATAMFLHIGVLHIALNLVCLYQAFIVELLFGRARFLAIYLAAGIGGNVAALYFTDEFTLVAGASGAVFGVYGAFGAFLVLRRANIPPDLLSRATRSLGSLLVVNLIIGFTVPNIAVSAHVGGLVIGFALAAVMIAVKRPSHRPPVDEPEDEDDEHENDEAEPHEHEHEHEHEQPPAPPPGD